MELGTILTETFDRSFIDACEDDRFCAMHDYGVSGDDYLARIGFNYYRYVAPRVWVLFAMH